MTQRKKQPEAKLVDNIRRAIRKEWPDSWDIKIWGGIASQGGRRFGQRPGVPDLLVLVDGVMFGIEVKTPEGGDPTEKQTAEMQRIRAAGGVCCVARDVDDTLLFIRTMLKDINGIRDS